MASCRLHPSRAGGNFRKGALSMLQKLKQDFRRNKCVYLMALPVVLYYVLFHYLPMSGLLIAFQDYNLVKGIWGSEWVGLQNFIDFFESYEFWRLLKNTLFLSFELILFTFPAPLILALLINEVRWTPFKKLVQTVSYLPHFISLVVICGLIVNFTASDGILNQILAMFGVESSTWLMRMELYHPIYIWSDVWQQVGWNSIVYLAAIAGIDPGLYEAATIDGAGRWQQLLHVTLPALVPTIVILFIMRIGNVMTLGHEKTILLYNPTIYETADVISSYIYRAGLLDTNYGFSTAVGMFNSVINCLLLWMANTFSRKLTQNSLW